MNIPKMFPGESSSAIHHRNTSVRQRREGQTWAITSWHCAGCFGGFLRIRDRHSAGVWIVFNAQNLSKTESTQIAETYTSLVAKRRQNKKAFRTPLGVHAAPQSLQTWQLLRRWRWLAPVFAQTPKGPTIMDHESFEDANRGHFQCTEILIRQFTWLVE